MKRILFTHIPKTAGTSFKESIIKQNYNDLYMYRGRKSLLDIYLKKPAFITGHFAFGLHKALPWKYEYLTFLGILLKEQFHITILSFSLNIQITNTLNISFVKTHPYMKFM